MLHTSLNLLSTHAGLHLTIITAPSYSERIEQELRFLSSLRPKPPVDRLQLVSGAKAAKGYAQEFEQTLSHTLDCLLRGEKELGDGVENRFSAHKLSFVVSDVNESPRAG